jgi:hypothetical protein
LEAGRNVPEPPLELLLLLELLPREPPPPPQAESEANRGNSNTPKIEGLFTYGGPERAFLNTKGRNMHFV